MPEHNPPDAKPRCSGWSEALITQLQTRRKELGVSQRDLNEYIGIAECLLAKWENGIRAPSAWMMECWADSLACEWVLIPKELIDGKSTEAERITRRTSNGCIT